MKAEVGRRVGRKRAVRKAEVVAVLGGGAALAGSWVVVAIDRGVPRFEARIFEWVNGWPDGLWPFVWTPMQLGSLGGSLAVVAATWAVSREPRLTVAVLASSQLAWWSGKVVKALASRERPANLLTDVNLREHASGLGYLSGHTATAFALATALAPSLPKPWRPVAIGLAAFVGVARIYSGAHLPLDVAGGAGLGILAGTLVRWGLGLGGAGLPVHDE